MLRPVPIKWTPTLREVGVPGEVLPTGIRVAGAEAEEPAAATKVAATTPSSKWSTREAMMRAIKATMADRLKPLRILMITTIKPALSLREAGARKR